LKTENDFSPETLDQLLKLIGSDNWSAELESALVEMQMDSYDRGNSDAMASITQSLQRIIETCGDVNMKTSQILKTIESVNTILTMTRSL